LLDERLCRQLLELLDHLQSEESGSQELISSLTALLVHAGAGDAGRSPLQIELILRSLNQSSAKRQVRALL